MLISSLIVILCPLIFMRGIHDLILYNVYIMYLINYNLCIYPMQELNISIHGSGTIRLNF